MTFRHNFADIVNSFGILLETVMINILKEIIKLLPEKMLKAINLH